MTQQLLQLTPATQTHLLEMMAWFPTADSTRIWGGPAFRFPFDEGTFTADTKLAELPSCALITPAGRLCGFGQYYLRQARCHFGRLVIAPDMRGMGLGTRLVQLLSEAGMPTLGVSECSLFVHPANARAIALYERLGFVRDVYPGDDLNTEDFHYMVRR
jgi:ribosomal protein S18 acetylase RimI-like enzyme